MMIKVVDYGMGNIGSMVNVLRKVGAEFEIASSAESLLTADKIILPGVGAFDSSIQKLKDGGWLEALELFKEKNRPILGVCLGIQLMMESSEEGEQSGLGWVKGRCVGFDRGRMNVKNKIPHMGWNIIEAKKANVLFDLAELEERFYFVHSYHVVCDEDQDVLTTSEYGYEFVSSYQKDNLVGVQFHPEKSHRYGISLIRKFVEDFNP